MSKIKKRYYTYTQFIGSWKYDGKGTGKRYLNTEDHCENNKLYRDVFSKHGLTYSIINEYFDELPTDKENSDAAYEAEIKLIALHRALGVKLLNDPKTKGGNAPPDMTGIKMPPRSKEWREKHSKLRKGSKDSEKTKAIKREAAKNRPPVTEETKQKQSKALKGRSLVDLHGEEKADEIRIKKSKSMTGKKMPIESGIKKSEKTKGIPKSSGHKDKISNGLKAYYQKKRDALLNAALEII